MFNSFDVKVNVRAIALMGCFFVLAIHSAVGRGDEWLFPEYAMTSSQWTDQNRKYFDHFVDLYREHSKDSPQIQEVGVEALQIEAARLAATQLAPATALLKRDPLLEKSDDQLARLRRVTLAGSSDPWILKALAGRAMEDSPQSRRRTIDQALAQLADSTYPASLRFRLLQHRATIAEEMKDISLERDSVRKMYDALDDYIAYIGERPEFSRVAMRLIHSLFSDFRLLSEEGDSMIERLGKNPDIDPWLVAMTRGHYFDQRGWRQRGGGFVSTVDSEDFDKFDKDQQAAAEEFLRAYEISPRRPEAAAGLIRVTMTSGPIAGKSTADWFQESLHGQIDYNPAQQAYLWSLRPRWGGSHQKILQFGMEMAASDRYDSELPDVLMKALYDVHEELEDWNRVLETADVYDAVKTHLDRRLEQTATAEKNAPQRNYYATQRMALANVRGEYDEAVRWLNEWNEDLHPAVLATFGLDTPAARSGIAARARFGGDYFMLPENASSDSPSPQSDPKYFQIESPQEYAAKMRSALEEVSAEDTRPFIQQRLRLAEMAAAFDQGQWLPLTFDRDFSDWYGHRELWTSDRDTAATVAPRGAWNLGLSHMLRTDGPREIEWSVVVASGASEGAPAGMELGLSRSIWNDRTDPGVLFFADPTQQRLGVYRNQEEELSKRVYQTPKRIRVKAWGPHVEMYMDGRLIHAGDLDGWDRVDGINGFEQCGSIDGELRFENVRVRQLDHDALAKDASADEKLEYYAKRLEQDPEFIEYLYRYGQTLDQSGDAEQSIEPLRRAVELDPQHTQLREAYSRVLIQTGRYAEAIDQCQRITDLTRNNSQWHGLAMAEHAMLLATVPVDELRDGRYSEQLVRRAFKLRKKDQFALWRTLACAQAELGAFDAATKSIVKAKSEATRGYQKREIEKIEAVIETKQPYRLGP